MEYTKYKIKSVFWVFYNVFVSEVWSSLRWIYMKLMASITTQEVPKVFDLNILIPNDNKADPSIHTQQWQQPYVS